MGQVIDFQAARAIKTAGDALERRLSAERARANIPDTIDLTALVEDARPRWPGGIDDLEL